MKTLQIVLLTNLLVPHSLLAFDHSQSYDLQRDGKKTIETE